MAKVGLGLLLAGPILAVVAADSPPLSSGDSAHLRYAYAGPATVEGDVEASCEAWGIDFYKQHAGELRLESQGGTLRVRDTWVNYTRVEDWTTWDDPAQYERVVNVPAGNLRLLWPASGLVTVFNYEYGDTPPFRLAFHADRLEVASVEAAPAGPAGFWVKHPTLGGVAPTPGAFFGWSRRVVSAGDLLAEGDLSLRLVEARVETADGRSVQLDSWRHETPLVKQPGVPVERETVRFQDALLDLRQARFVVPAGTAAGICGALKGRGVGTVTAGDATGEATVGGQSLSFAEKVLSYSGSFAWDEKPHGLEGQAGRVEATSNGSIQVLGLDFQPVAQGTGPRLDGRTLSLMAVLVLVGVWLVKSWGHLAGAFYARFGPERALAHPRRRQIHQVVCENPGLTPTALVERLGLPRMSLVYHLQVLSRNRKVRLESEGKQIRVWPGHWVPKERAEHRRTLLLEDTRFAFLVHSLQGQPCRVADVVQALADQFELTVRGARNVVRRAVALGLVREEPSAVAGVRGRVIRCD